MEKRFKASLAELPEVEHRVVTSEVLAPLVAALRHNSAPVFSARQLHHTCLFDEPQRRRQYPCIREIF